MEYGHREPMKSKSAKEPTAFTMQTIQQLLAAEQVQGDEEPTQRLAGPMPTKTPLVQTPPHMRSAGLQPREIADLAIRAERLAQERKAALAKAATIPPMGAMGGAASAMDKKPKSFLNRLIGR